MRSLTLLLFAVTAVAAGGVPTSASGERLFLDRIVREVNGDVLFQTQLDFPPASDGSTSLPSILTSSGPGYPPIELLTSRQLLLAEARRLGIEFRVPGEIDIEPIPAPVQGFDGGCHSEQLRMMYAQENDVLARAVEVKFEPFVRVSDDDISEFTGEYGIIWSNLSPLVRSEAYDAAYDEVFLQKLNERVQEWLTEVRERAQIQTFSE